MMHRIALGLEYDGSHFHGWQRQTQLVSVQSTLELALSGVAFEPIKTICAGRTDAGVHATEQVVHFDTLAKRDERAWVFGSNTRLPPSMRALWAYEVPPDFSARRSATGRRYRYVIYNHPVRPGLLRSQVTWVYKKLDVQNMIGASKYWLGEHDFSSFRAAECQSRSPIRTLRSLQITREGDQVILDFSANAFLHHMVRNMVGVLIAIGTGKMPVEWARTVLMARDRRQAAMTAPPNGLYLVSVQYPKEFGLPATDPGPWFFNLKHKESEIL